jgi:acyl dehydratase
MPDAGWYFDDFEVGQVHTTMGRTLTESDLMSCVTLGGIFEEMFINAEYAKEQTLFKARACPIMLILLVAEGLWIQTGRNHAGRAFLGLDGLRVSAPALLGDTIRVEVRPASTRVSNSRPDHGIMSLEHKVLNQRDVEVMTYTTTRMLARRSS